MGVLLSSIPLDLVRDVTRCTTTIDASHWIRVHGVEPLAACGDAIAAVDPGDKSAWWLLWADAGQIEVDGVPLPEGHYALPRGDSRPHPTKATREGAFPVSSCSSSGTAK